MTSLGLRAEQGLESVAEVTVVPNTQMEPNEEQLMTQDGEASDAHIYFKDLKLLAHDNVGDSEEEEEYYDQGTPEYDDIDSASPVFSENTTVCLLNSDFRKTTATAPLPSCPESIYTFNRASSHLTLSHFLSYLQYNCSLALTAVKSSA